MHILGILGTIVTVLYLLDRVGIDIGWINPWSWRRRRAWAKRYEGDPVYSVEDPIQVAAILIAGAAKLEGDISAGQKQAILEQFEQKFSLDARSASDLLASATHLLGAPQVIGTQLRGLAARHQGSFSDEQLESLLEMVTAVATVDGEPGSSQQEYLDDLRSSLTTREQEGTWE